MRATHVVVTLAVVLSVLTGSLRAHAGTPAPCTKTWQADARGTWDGNWFDAAHWNGGSVPTQEDDVCINGDTSTYTVTLYGTLNSRDARAKSLRIATTGMSSPTLRIGDGLGGVLKVDGRVNVGPNGTIVVIGSCFGGLLSSAGGIESGGTVSTSSNSWWCPWGPPALVETGTGEFLNQGKLDVWAETRLGTLRNEKLLRVSGAVVVQVNGDYTQTAAGTYAATYRKPTTALQQPPSAGGFSLLNVSGNADLAGTLEVVRNGFAPAAPASFPIVNAASRTCAWSTVNGAIIVDSTYFRPDCPATGESLSVQTATLTAPGAAEPATAVRVQGTNWPSTVRVEMAFNQLRDLHNLGFNSIVALPTATQAGAFDRTVEVPLIAPSNLRVRSGVAVLAVRSQLVTGLSIARTFSVVSSCGRAGLYDQCLDGDGVAVIGTAQNGGDEAFEVLWGDALVGFPDTRPPGEAHGSFHGLMMVDGDSEPGTISQDDDFWVDNPRVTDLQGNLVCPWAQFDGDYSENRSLVECKVLDAGAPPLMDGTSGTSCFEGCGIPSTGTLTFRDLNDDGIWNSGEDLVVDRGPMGWPDGIFN